MSKTAHELTRKEMKAPDRFQQVAGQAASWMAGRQKQLAMVVVLLLAVAVFAIAVSYFLDARRAKSGALLSAAIVALGGEVVKDAGAATPSRPGAPTYKSAEEKHQAVLAAAEAVRQRGGQGAAVGVAALLEGDAQAGLGRWDEAIASYERYLGEAGKDDSLRFSGLDGLARAQEGKGDLDAAAKSWEEAAAIPQFKDRATLERARVLAKAGKADEARKALESLPPESPLKGEAQERLTRLGGGK